MSHTWKVAVVVPLLVLPWAGVASAQRRSPDTAIGDRVFDDDAIHSYYLYLQPAELATLQDLGPQVGAYEAHPVYVHARLRLGDQVLEPIGVRYRGDQSLWDCVEDGQRRVGVRYPQFGFGQTDICAKFSLKLDFDRYDRDQRLFGLKALNLRSMSKDPTKMHERLGYALFRDMGIVAPRVVHARLYVNDEYWGLFSVVEQVDGRFTRARFPGSGNGNLYKEAWPDASFPDARLRQTRRTNRRDRASIDVSDFAAFRDAVVSETTRASNFAERLGGLVDIDYLARYMAVDRGIANFDGVVSCYAFGPGIRHNFYWYQDAPDQPFILIPWDLDLVMVHPEPNFWTDNQRHGRSAIPNWNVSSEELDPIVAFFDPGGQAVASGMGYPVFPIDKDKFLRLLRDAAWPEFVAAAERFLERHLVQEVIDRRIARWSAQIAGAVAEDPTLDAEEWTAFVEKLRRDVPALRRNLRLMKEERLSPR
jgi:spore coat protein CotH